MILDIVLDVRMWFGTAPHDDTDRLILPYSF